MDIQPKRFIVVPRDAFDLLCARFVDEDAAIAAATDRCGETGMTTYVIEIKAVAARADRPVTVKKFNES